MKRKGLVIGAVAVLLVAGTWAALPDARLTDVYPREGLVQPGQPVHLTVAAQAPWYARRPVTVTVTKGLDRTPIATFRTRGGEIDWTPPGPGGYGVTASVGSHKLSTAVAVGNSWTDQPRYGFLSDFAPTDKDQAARFGTMAKFHLDGLQFYDWMYRHSQYLPPTPEYRDPLNRLLSKDVVLQKIALAHSHGMAAMAYTAVYAAPGDFWANHEDWGLYDITGRNMDFGNGFLYIMNPSPGGPWANYIVDQYKQVVQQMGFDGIHLDQYGDPKTGYTKAGLPVDVGAGLVSLINATKAAVGPEHSVLFNDVGGWPLVDTAKTKNDAIYVEVWPPYVTFQHLRQLVTMGKNLSGQKAVVLAAYNSPVFEPTILLTDATIFASGGYHIELGEGNNMLADPYFPKYKPMSPALSDHLRRYYDVTVRYQDLLYSKDQQNWDPAVTLAGAKIVDGATAGGVWPVAHENSRYAVLSLINLSGVADAKWHSQGKQEPAPLESRQVTVAMDQAPKALYAINPDGSDPSPVPVKFQYQDGKVSFTLDHLTYWSILVFEK